MTNQTQTNFQPEPDSPEILPQIFIAVFVKFW